MENRISDEIYCNVDMEKIKNASPTIDEEVLRYHHNYIFERHKIYKKKEIDKLPISEWTNDEIFKTYKFTNVRRELDRESKWLIKHVCENDSITITDKIMNCILFRVFNKSSTLEIINAPITEYQDVEMYRKMFDDYDRLHPKYAFFTSAFNTGGIKAANAFYDESNIHTVDGIKKVYVYNDKEKKLLPLIEARQLIKDDTSYKILGSEPNIQMRVMYLIKKIYLRNIPDKILNAKNQAEAFEIIGKLPGFGKFLAYQIFVDLTYIKDFKFSENEFVVSGPGCDRGLDFLLLDKDGMNYEESIFWVRNNIVNEWKKRGLDTDLDELFNHLPEHDRCLNIMMLENSFCELSKYTRAARGTGRPRVKYKEHKEESSLLEE